MARGRPDQPSERRQREVAEARVPGRVARPNIATNNSSTLTIPLPLNQSTPRRANESNSSIEIDDQISNASENSLEEQLQQFFDRQEAFMKRLEDKVENRLPKSSKKLSKDLTVSEYLL